MDKNKKEDREPRAERLPMGIPPVVSAEEWEVARQQLLVKEKALTHARDALAAERRRMPWLALEKAYQFDGPQGRRACSTCSTAVVSSSFTAPSSSPGFSAGPNMPAAAAHSWPIRWLTSPIYTRATPRSCTHRGRRSQTSSA